MKRTTRLFRSWAFGSCITDLETNGLKLKPRWKGRRKMSIVSCQGIPFRFIPNTRNGRSGLTSKLQGSQLGCPVGKNPGNSLKGSHKDWFSSEAFRVSFPASLAPRQTSSDKLMVLTREEVQNEVFLLVDQGSGLPIFPLITLPPTRDTHLSWANKVMLKKKHQKVQTYEHIPLEVLLP